MRRAGCLAGAGAGAGAEARAASVGGRASAALVDCSGGAAWVTMYAFRPALMQGSESTATWSMSDMSIVGAAAGYACSFR